MSVYLKSLMNTTVRSLAAFKNTFSSISLVIIIVRSLAAFTYVRLFKVIGEYDSEIPCCAAG